MHDDRAGMQMTLLLLAHRVYASLLFINTLSLIQFQIMKRRAGSSAIAAPLQLACIWAGISGELIS